MKFNQFGAMTALIAGFAFVGCSSNSDNQPREGNSSVGFNLRSPDGVVITSVAYDLNTSGGADVLAGSIPVPNDNSVINGTLDSLPIGSYSLLLTATGTYNGAEVSCTSAPPTAFTLAANQDLTLASPLNLVCTYVNLIGDDAARVSFSANVTLEQVNEVRRVVEAFGVTPNSVIGVGSGSSCAYPPIAINVANSNAAISYSWSATPDGTFSLNATSTNGTYNCASDGAKNLTVTATLGTASASRTVPVSCGTGCGSVGTGGTGGGGAGGSGGTDTAGTGGTDTGGTGGTDTGGTGGTDTGGTGGTDTGGTGGTDTGGTGGTDTGGTGGTDTGGTAGTGGTGGAGNPCRECILANADLNPLQTELCDTDARCTAVQECVYEADCFSPIAAVCYCGPDVSTCENPAFVPVGPCVETIRTASGIANPTNAEVLGNYFAFEVPLGVAMGIIDETTRACPSQCGFE